MAFFWELSKFCISIDKKLFALFTAAICRLFKFAVSIVATTVAFCSAACCVLLKFCNWIAAYLFASATAIGTPASYTACIIAAEAMLEEPKPLCAIMADTLRTLGDAQAGSSVPSPMLSNNLPT